MDKKFELFWRTGEKEIIEGTNIAEALNKHYSSGALRALDFYQEENLKDETEWVFDKEKRTWKRKENKVKV